MDLEQIMSLKTPGKNIDELYDAYFQIRKMIMVLMDGGIEFDNLNLSGIGRDGIDARKIDRDKNYVRDSSFEIENSSYWTGDGVVSQDANFYGSRSLKISSGDTHQSNPLTQSDLNPTYWGFFNPTRLSFQKKFGKLKVEILDYSNNNAPIALKNEAGATNNYAIFGYNSNWDTGFCTLTFNPGRSAKLTIKFTNIDNTADVYIDAVDLRPDRTGMPVLYRDGSRSQAYNGFEIRPTWVGTNAQALAKTDWELNDVGVITDDYTEHKQTIKTTSSTILKEEAGIIEVNSSGSTTQTLPTLTSADIDRIEYYINNVGSGVCTIGGTVNGVVNPTLNQYESKHIRWNGSTWYSMKYV